MSTPHRAPLGTALLASFLMAGSSLAQDLSTPILLPGDTSPEVAAGEQGQAQIAAGEVGGGQPGYLVVWEDGRSSRTGTVQPPTGLGDNTDIYAARLDADGAVIDTIPIVVNEAVWSQRQPHVAWNGEHYLVVWESTRQTQFFYTDGIYAARVSAEGVLLDDTPIVVEDSDDTDEYWPRVASDGTNWMVVWTDYAGGSVNTLDGALISPAGQVIQKQTVVTPASQSFLPTNYRLVHAQGRYVMAHERSYSGAWVREIDEQLTPLAPAIQVGTGLKPNIATNGSEFYVTWMSGGVRGAPLDSSLNPLVTGGALLSQGLNLVQPLPCVAWDGSGWTVGLQATLFPGSGLFTMQVDAAGTPATAAPNVLAQHGADVRDIVAAPGSGAVQFIWSDQRIAAGSTWAGDRTDLFGARVLSNGTSTSQEPITLSAPAQTRPSLAGDANAGYLVAFLREVAGETRVQVQRLDGTGLPLDPQPTTLFSGGRELGSVDVAWNGNVWLVAWERYLPSSGGSANGEILYTRVASNGAVLDSQPTVLMQSNFPAVAAIGDQFLVVGRIHTTSFERIWCKRVRGSDGTILDPTAIDLGPGSSAPDVVAFPTRWLVAWNGIGAAFVEANGTAGAIFNLGNSPSSDNAPSLAAFGTLGVVVWQTGSLNYQRDIRMRRFLENGTLLDSSAGVVVSNAPNGQFAPAVGSDGIGFLAAFNDYRIHDDVVPGIGDVFGSRIDGPGTVLDLSGLPIAANSRGPEGNPAVAGDANLFLVATAELMHSPLGSYRIVVRRLTEDQPASPFCEGNDLLGVCPCDNPGILGAGCSNSTALGGRLEGQGSTSVQADDLRFSATQLPPLQPALLFQGTTPLAGGFGTPFGDGIRCVGGTIVRLGVDQANAAGVAEWGPGLSTSGAWQPGQLRRFQAWYRDPVGAPCGTGFNLTNGLSVSLTP